MFMTAALLTAETPSFGDIKVKLSFDLRGQTPGLETVNIKVNERLANVLN